MAKKQFKSKISAAIIDAPIDDTEKVSTKKNVPASTPNHLNPVVKDCTITTNWKDMQALAKEWGVKAGGRGVSSDVLHTWLCNYQRLGAEAFTAKYPEAVSKSKKTSTRKPKAEKIERELPDCLKGMSFREAQAYVKQYRADKIIRSHKGKFDEYCKTFAIGGEIVKTAATSWDGIINQLIAIDAYVETKM